MSKKYCYLFTEGNAKMRELLGGKGANLAEMTNIGLPVPQGFTITTEACTQYYEDGRQINDAIMAESHGNGMATTLTGLLLYFDQAYILNCGDSRTYRLRYDNFRQLTRDHSERNRLNDPSAPANLMYNCLGIPEAFIDITPAKVVEGDQYIICSDGLSDYASEAEMQTNIQSAQALVDAALAAGAPDNVTVITLKFT